MLALIRPLFTILGIVVLVLIVLAALALVRRGRPAPSPYERAKALFSPAERHFLVTLESALGSTYRIFGKVRVADLASVKKGLTPRARQAALNRVAYKHFDFLLCSKQSCEPACAIELNDSSHNSKGTRRRDAFIEEVCRSISLPMVTFPVRQSYEVSEIRERVGQVLQEH